ncbi:MAG: aminodeoxychorismate synthase component I, partial [Steroidobacteraceae bacterium]
MLRRLAARWPERYPMLLDSAATGALSRASMLLAEPRGALWLTPDGRLGAQGLRPQGVSFLAALEHWWLSERATATPGAGPDAAGEPAFSGGWALFLGYELAQEIEPR